jgi:HEAT repeat protein
MRIRMMSKTRLIPCLIVLLAILLPCGSSVHAQDPDKDDKFKKQDLEKALKELLYQTDEEAQYRALEKLRGLGFKESLEPIIRFAEKTKYPHLSHHAGEIVRALDPAAAVEILRKDLAGSNRLPLRARNRLILLWEIGSPAAIETLYDNYKGDARKVIRTDFLRAVGELRIKKASGILTAALSSRDHGMANQAAISIGKMEDPELASALVSALDKNDGFTNMFAAWALGRIDDPSVFGIVAGRMGKGRKGLDARAKALEGCAADETHVEKLIAMLKSTRSTELKVAACRGLGRLAQGNEDVMRLLLAVMLGNDDRVVRTFAFEALSLVATPEFGPAIMKRAGQRDQLKLRHVYELLGDLRIKEAAPMLLKRIFKERKNQYIWKTAAINLWKIDDRATNKKFEDFVNKASGKNAVVRGVQVMSFRRNATGFRFLINLLRKYGNGTQEQFAVEKALERLTGHFFGPQFAVWRKWFEVHPEFFTDKQQDIDRKKWRDEFDKENKGFRQTEQTEEAVQRGLRWLARHQDADGAWDPQYYMRHDPVGNVGSRDGARVQLDPVGTTALTVMTFLGAGYSPLEGKYKDAIARGLEYVMARQQVDGDYLKNDLIGGYNRPIALLALAEAYNITRDPRFRPYVQAGSDFIASIQNRLGGWRYRVVIETTDTSCCSWNAFALLTARKSGLKVREIVLEGIRGVFDEYSSPVRYQREEFIEHLDPEYGFDVGTGTKYKHWSGYQNSSFPDSKYATTALGLMTRIFLGYRRTHPFCIGAANCILEDFFEEIPANENWSKYRSRREYPTYAWYYGTLAMHQMGGRYFRKWNEVIQRIVPGTQAKSGPDEGSWPVWNHDMVGGRLYTTCMGVLTLETYYRYLPVLED